MTHKDITRFFMTIPEAASLVIQAGSMAKGGDVFVLNMGEPVKIVDLAKRMIQLSGLELKTADNPDGDIEIEYSGLRPAEKLFEELLVGDNVVGTEHSKIMRANEVCLEKERLELYLLSMQQASERYDFEGLRDLLKQAVAGYQPYSELVDYLSIPQKESNIIKLR